MQQQSLLRRSILLLGDIAAAVEASKCDCITDTLSVRFANEYNLEQLNKMKSEPIEVTQEALEKVLDKNNDCLKGCIKF